MAPGERLWAAVNLFLTVLFAYKSGSVPPMDRLGRGLNQSSFVRQDFEQSRVYENSDSMVFRRPLRGALSSLVPEAQASKSTFQWSDLARNRAQDTSNIYV